MHFKILFKKVGLIFYTPCSNNITFFIIDFQPQEILLLNNTWNNYDDVLGLNPHPSAAKVRVAVIYHLPVNLIILSINLIILSVNLIILIKMKK